MATTDADTIKAFLVSLGFAVDQAGLKKFTSTLDTTEKAALGISKAVVGVGVAAQAMVAHFAFSMEKLYYASRRTGASVDNLMAYEAGARRIGIAGDTARESIEGMAAAVRMNPGMRGLLDGLVGHSTSGMDQSKAMIELVQSLAKMPHYVGAQYAQMFGLDEKTFLMLKDGLPELVKGEERHLQLLKQAGVDGQTAADAAHEYANSLRDIGDKAGVVGNRLSIALLPTFRELDHHVNRFLDSMMTLKSSDFTADNLKGFAGQTFDDLMNWIKTNAAKQQAEHEASWKAHGVNVPGAREASGKIKPYAGGASTASSLFAGIEQKYGLPAGLLDRVWSAESNRGDPKYMRSAAGAKGHMGFMDKTASAYGVANPDDLAQSAEGAGHMFSDLLKRYGGNLQSAAAAYNYGMGNFEKAGGLGGRLPKETQDYIAKISGQPITIHQQTDIHIASTDPVTAGREAGRAMKLSYSDILRNTTARVQ
jgi:hypothetical protein